MFMGIVKYFITKRINNDKCLFSLFHNNLCSCLFIIDLSKINIIIEIESIFYKKGLTLKIDLFLK